MNALVQVVARYLVDPLVYHGKMRANWAFQALSVMVLLP